MSDPTGPRDPGIGGRENEWAMGEADWAGAPEHGEPGLRRMIPAFLVGALAGMVALGLVWATTAILAGNDSGRVATSTSTTGAELRLWAGASPRPSRQERCQRADTALAESLRAAVPALDQWELHIGAMNKLVVGAITLPQATAFWDRTRVGAKRNLDGFYSATRPFVGVDCPPPEALTQASTELSSCSQHVAQKRRALEAVRITMQTWNTHVRHMEMLRMGHMSPAAATRLWLASWVQGVRELQAYRSAERAVDGSGSC